MKLWHWLTAFGRRRRLEAEMAEELQAHLEFQIERNLAAGMTPAEAQRAARRQFGHFDKITEEVRDAQRSRAVADFWQDLRFGARMLLKRPGFTVAAGLTLALGIGFVATLFTVLNGVAFGRLPFEDADRIVSVGAAAHDFERLAPLQTTLEGFSLAASQSANFRVGDTVHRYPGAVVSASFLDPLRARPLQGRSFLPPDEQPGAERPVLIDASIWREALQGDPAVLGREIQLNGEIRTVIGVLPEGFGFPRNARWWTPRTEGTPVPGAQLFGRLKPGISSAQAEAEFTGLAARLAADRGDPAHQAGTVEVAPFARQGLKDAVRVVLLAIWGATFLVLLLACANVTNLIFARASERSRELAIRCAVGATRGRLIRQMLAESLLLAVLGAIGGGFLAAWSTTFLWNAIAPEAALTGGLPFWVRFDLDARVFVLLALAAGVATLLTGLTPALKASRIDLSEGIKSGGGAGLRLSRFTRFLINVQMALSVCLVTGAGLFLTVLIAFNQKRLPYPAESVLTARISPEGTTPAEVGERAARAEEMLAHVAALPGVDAVALTSAPLLRPQATPLAIEGHTYADARRPQVLTETVSLGYFATLGAGLMEGRLFNAADRFTTPLVAVVNPAFLQRFNQGQSMLGQRVQLGDAADAAWVTIVGVVRDVGSMKAGRESHGAMLYRPLAQQPGSEWTLLLRGAGDASRFAAPLRQQLAALDAQLPLSDVMTVQRIIELERIGINVPGLLFMVCGVGALLLAAVGVYGVVAFSVRVRMREFGVRLALGASPGDVTRLVLRQGLRQIAIGLGAGLLLALALSAVMNSTFTGLGRSAYDGWIYLSVVVLLGAVGTCALWFPARRGSRADPMVALRAE